MPLLSEQWTLLAALKSLEPRHLQQLWQWEHMAVAACGLERIMGFSHTDTTNSSDPKVRCWRLQQPLTDWKAKSSCWRRWFLYHSVTSVVTNGPIAELCILRITTCSQPGTVLQIWSGFFKVINLIYSHCPRHLVLCEDILHPQPGTVLLHLCHSLLKVWRQKTNET